MRAGWGTYPARRAARRGKPIAGRLAGTLLARLWPLAGRVGRGGVKKLIHFCGHFWAHVSSMCHLCVTYVSPSHDIDEPIKQIVSIEFQWAGFV